MDHCDQMTYQQMKEAKRKLSYEIDLSIEKNVNPIEFRIDGPKLDKINSRCHPELVKFVKERFPKQLYSYDPLEAKLPTDKPDKWCLCSNYKDCISSTGQYEIRL